MKYNFDAVVDRKNSDSEKWDCLDKVFGRTARARDLLPMWVADMDFNVPEQVSEAIVQRAKHGVYGYTARPAGIDDAVAGWTAKRHGWDIEKKWLVYTPGVVPALNMAIMAYTAPGDKVLIQPPVYPPFYRVIVQNGRAMVSNPLRLENGRYAIDFADLEAKLEDGVKLFILCSPHNPVGRVWTENELLRLGELCLRQNVIIVADEIHSDILRKGARHVPIASLSPDLAACTVTCIAPSKTFNVAGLASSVAVIPDEKLRGQFEAVIKRIGIGAGNIFGNIAMEVAYRYGAEWLDQLLAYLDGNVSFLETYLRENVPQIKPLKPEGTYLAWLDCRGLGLDQEDLTRFLIEKARVGLNNGLDFGSEGQGFMRLNFGCPRSLLAEGLQRIATALKTGLT